MIFFLFQLSYGDLAMYFGLDTFLNNAEMTSAGVSADDIAEYAKLIKDQPLLTGVYDMVKANPKVADYLAKRPNYDY